VTKKFKLRIDSLRPGRFCFGLSEEFDPSRPSQNAATVAGGGLFFAPRRDPGERC